MSAPVFGTVLRWQHADRIYFGQLVGIDRVTSEWWAQSWHAPFKRVRLRPDQVETLAGPQMLYEQLDQLPDDPALRQRLSPAQR